MTRKHLFIALATLGAIALSFYAWGQYTQKNPKREHPMTPLTKNMKTVCLGRYLVDMPAQAEFSLGSAEIDDIKIEHVGPAPSEGVFRDKVKRREADLRFTKHDTEGTRLREAVDINDGTQRLLVYRDDNSDTFLAWVEAAVWSNHEEWLINFDAANESVPNIRVQVTNIAAHLQEKNMQDIPNTPGFCIANGLVTGGSHESENLTGGIHMESPDFSITIKSETSGPRERGNTLWDRTERAEKDVNEIYGIKLPIGVVRRAEVKVDGRKGQEYVTITSDKGFEVFNAKAEIYGDATPKKPTFKIEMDAAWLKKSGKDQKQGMLSREEALAIWDAVLKSIHPRPGTF